MTIEKNKVDDDLETMDNFFNDVSSLMEKKGVNVNKSNHLYTLFDDLTNNLDFQLLSIKPKYPFNSLSATLSL